MSTCPRCGAPKLPFRFCRKCWLRDRRRRGLDDPRVRKAEPKPPSGTSGNTAAVYVNGEHIGNGTFTVTYPGSNQ